MALCITLLFAAIAVSAGMTTTNGECIYMQASCIIVHYAGCSDKYTNQPPNELNCNPLHTTVTLQCATDSNSHEVTWYWTQNFSDAGIRGEEILPGSTGYTVSVFGAHLKHLTFVVMNSSLGYYWCEISNAVNASLRSSTITPVCAQQTLSKCNESYVFGIHHIGEECAMENSPLVFNRPPLPKCFPQTEQADIVSSNSIHDFYPTTTQAKLISSSLVPLESFTSTPALDTVIFTTTSPYQASTETLVSHPTTETPTARPTAASAVFPLFWVLVVVLGMLLFAVFGLSVIAITVLVIFKKKISLRKFGKLL